MQRRTRYPRLQHERKDCNVNCGETEHLAAWKGRKTIPVITRPATRKPRKMYAQATNKDTSKGEKKTPPQEENTTEVIAGLTERTPARP
ncbi:hypothetical protein AVEN_114158-1 [Araneus ventricosus]|uniref:Uncharacterized protein n=1 Tax=Araneus ventricosus TaxID=182803 RepID=A0A4Y2RZN5_ARAVE|nr:hypothetical protein AVEN_114158-1 [Araneus ventricosus]